MLFKEIVYGPIHSRRLGVSLGVNLLPAERKICSFDCVYCEIGWNADYASVPLTQPGAHVPSREAVAEALRAKLTEMKQQDTAPDVITFSGNGEPTIHPDFENIIIDTCHLRDELCPSAQVSVLTNSTQIFKTEVMRGLMAVDKRLLKLDSAVDQTMRLMDQPVNNQFTVARLVERLKAFQGDLTIQTCFLRGEHNGRRIDNTTEAEIAAWLDAIRVINPAEVMIYVIDRKTPCDTLEKISADEMNAIAQRVRKLGIAVQVSA